MTEETQSIKLKFGVMTFGVSSDMPDDLSQLEGAYALFLTDADPDVSLHLHRGSLPDLDAWEQVFNSGGSWDLKQTPGKWGIRLISPVLEPNIYQIGIFDNSFKRGDIFIPDWLNFPFTHGFTQILAVHFLARGAGVLVHACGIKDGNCGRLFVGVSGAGKSTMAQLWSQVEGATILSDDRIILHRQDGRFWMFGTPWHGDARGASPESVPVGQVFILRHGQHNQVVPLSAADATARLLVRAFPTFWDRNGMNFTLDFLSRLAQEIPCSELGFVPDAGVVDYVRCLN